MAGLRRVYIAIYINRPETLHIKICTAVPQEVRQKVQSKLRQVRLREQRTVLELITRILNDNNSYKNNTSSNSYKPYDDGYDDVYMDGDYADNWYNSDSDYADGVDNAIEDDYEGGDGD